MHQFDLHIKRKRNRTKKITDLVDFELLFRDLWNKYYPTAIIETCLTFCVETKILFISSSAKKVALKKLTGKRLCQSLFEKFLRTPIYIEHVWWLLLRTDTDTMKISENGITFSDPIKVANKFNNHVTNIAQNLLEVLGKTKKSASKLFEKPKWT